MSGKNPATNASNDELNGITNSSSSARRFLETGCVRLSEIPKELMEENASEARAKWLESKLPDIYRYLAQRNQWLNLQDSKQRRRHPS